MTGTGPARYGLPAALTAIAATAWGAIALGAGDIMLPAFCAPTASGPRAAASFSLVLALNPPATLVAGWVVMIIAMMAPLILAPLRHVADRSFARRRRRGIVLFACGYCAVWTAAGVVLQPLVLAARLATPDSLLPLGIVVALAVAWQVSPAKQWSLNRCHRQPHLAAFGAEADRDAFRFGLTNGLYCVGACWALMLLPLFMATAHIVSMAAVALFVLAERLEDPAPLAWRWRGAGKAVRMMLAEPRMRLTTRSYIAAASQPR